jgi:predicted transcriptional regulator
MTNSGIYSYDYLKNSWDTYLFKSTEKVKKNLFRSAHDLYALTHAPPYPKHKIRYSFKVLVNEK